MSPLSSGSAQWTASPLSSVLLDPDKMVKSKGLTGRKIKVQKNPTKQKAYTPNNWGFYWLRSYDLLVPRKLSFGWQKYQKVCFPNQNWWILLRCLNLSNKPKYPYLKLSRAYFKLPRHPEVTKTFARRCTATSWFLLMEWLGPVDGIRLQNCVPLMQGLPSTCCMQQYKLACIKTVLYQHWWNSFLKSSSLILLSRT